MEVEETIECGSQSMFDEDAHSQPFSLSDLPTQPLSFDSEFISPVSWTISYLHVERWLSDLNASWSFS